MNKIIILILILLSSCGKKKETPTALQELGFFDIVYETIATRAIGDTSWISNVGTREVKFLTTTTVTEDESLPPVLQGTYTYSFQGFSKLASQAACSGGFNGSFDMTYQDQGTTSGTTVTQEPKYDPLGTYNADTNTTTTADTNIAIINTFEFSLTLLNKSFTPLNCETPPNTNTIKVVRFSNGDLIEDDTAKNLQYYLRPKLRIAR